MLCVGGPLHGKDIECNSEYLNAPILDEMKVRSYSSHIDYKEFKIAVYKRERVASLRTGRYVEIWVLQ